jgi:2-methylcitrate dehydratase PrpD
MPALPMKNASNDLPQGVTQACVDFIVDSRPADVPPEAVRIARRCVFDTLGLYVAGLHEASTRILIELARDQGGKPETRLLAGGGLRVPATAAARVLATSAHAHDFDDTQVSHDPAHTYGLLTHPSVPPLTAALVLADGPAASADADAWLHAFLVGFEVECKISEWMPAEHYLRGHHSSGTVGTFGATATAAKLLGLDRTRTAHAIGIAASLAAGIRCNFGTMTKPLHVGRAAENGVLAAQLALRGYTADPQALDGRWGFPAVLAGGLDAVKVEQGFGRTWSIVDPGVSIKPYPSGILTHQTMDAARALFVEHDIAPDRIAAIDLHAGDNILAPIRYPIAANGLQAKFSLPALVAMLALRRDVSIHEFDDAFVAGDAMQAMQRRIRTHPDAEINARGFDRIRSRVRVTLADGRVIERDADERYRGGPLLPMDAADLRRKFDGCVRGLLDDAGAARLAAVLDVQAPPPAAAALMDELARLVEPV